MAVLHEYEWLVVVGALAAFAFGFATGSNDVANAFGTSVGSKTLTLRQAVIIASIFEFAGSLLLGRVSTNTIASGIADITAFQREPEVFAYGMCCALGVGAVFQLIASYFECNVSATHSIIGAIVGFSLVYDGSNAVQWAVKDTASFPPYKGVVAIVMAWFIAPILTGSAAAIFFLILRTCVLRRPNAFKLSFIIWPLAVLVTVWINAYFVFTKGAKKMLSANDKSWDDRRASWVGACIAAFAALISIAFIPLMYKKINRMHDGPIGMTPADGAASGKGADGHSADPENPKWWQKVQKAAFHGVNVDIHKAVEDDPVIARMHANAEVFSPKVEHAFKYLQVFSAICVIFAHGAGEVGYMAGPLTSIYEIYKNGTLNKNATPKIWVLLISAFGLVFGLATYGYNVTRAMGVKLAKLSATRGFCAELATAFVIMIAAQYGLPTSSSQCITGAIMGVGLCEGVRGVQWRVFAKQFIAWMSTLVVVGSATAALFAQGVFSPSISAGKDVIAYENRITNLTANLYRDLNSTLYSYRGAAGAGALGARLDNGTWYALNRTLAENSRSARGLADTKTQTTRPDRVFQAYQRALALLENNTIYTLGQREIYPGSRVCNDANVQGIQSNTTVACRAPRLSASV